MRCALDQGDLVLRCADELRDGSHRLSSSLVELHVNATGIDPRHFRGEVDDTLDRAGCRCGQETDNGRVQEDLVSQSWKKGSRFTNVHARACYRGHPRKSKGDRFS